MQEWREAQRWNRDKLESWEVREEHVEAMEKVKRKY